MELELCAEDAVLLCAKIGNSPDIPDHVTGLRRGLILKLASVFNELVSDMSLNQGTVTIGVTEEETWLMRGCISPFDRPFASKPTQGIALLRKIHQLMIGIQPINSMEDIIYKPKGVKGEDTRPAEDKAEDSPGDKPDDGADTPAGT